MKNCLKSHMEHKEYNMYNIICEEAYICNANYTLYIQAVQFGIVYIPHRGTECSAGDKKLNKKLTPDTKSAAAEPGCVWGEEGEGGLVAVQVHLDALHLQPPPLTQAQDHLPDSVK